MKAMPRMELKPEPVESWEIGGALHQLVDVSELFYIFEDFSKIKNYAMILNDEF